MTGPQMKKWLDMRVPARTDAGDATLICTDRRGVTFFSKAQFSFYLTSCRGRLGKDED